MAHQALRFVITLALLTFIWNVTALVENQQQWVHRPVYVANPIQCKAYKIVSYDDLSTRKTNALPYLVPPKDYPYVPVPPNLKNRYSGGPKIAQFYWVEKGPIVGNSSSARQIIQILSDPTSYAPGPDPGAMEFLTPDYVFDLTGSSGSLVVYLQSSDGTFAVNKYDIQGKFVETSGPVRPKGNWSSIIKQIFS